MANIPGVDFYTGQWDAGITSGNGIAVMASKGVRFGIAKVGQAYFLDGRWDEHKTKLLGLGSGFLKGAYWFLERDHRFNTTPGFFYPPFRKGLTYRSTTYGGHSNYSVDFNRGSTGDDEGDDVLAAAAGTVVARDNTNGLVTINHYGGEWRTEYVHMKNIAVNVSDTVTRGQKIGEISSVGNSTGSHLHHVHYRKSPGGVWVRTKMRIMGVDMNASVADSDTRPSSFGVTGQLVTGVALASEGGGVEYTGATQARRFKNAIGDPAGWLCALDVEAAPKVAGSITSVYGANPRWLQVKQFLEEWNRLTDGYPLFLYSSRGYWSGVRDGDAPGDAKALGFTGLWSADWTQLSGGLWLSSFADGAKDLSFSRTTATPNAAGYAGFARATILQFGSLRYKDAGGVNRSLDGNASDLTFAELRTLATTPAGTGPGTGNTFVPDVVDEEESVALDELTEADLTAGTRTEDNSETIAAGRVISTDPVAGTEVATSTAIDYVVSLGPVAPGGSLDPNPANPCEG